MSKTKKNILIIVGLGCLVYANMLSNTFVWDDKGFIYSAPFAHPLYTLTEVFIAKGQAIYRPLFYLYLNVISILSQGNPTIIHLLQLGLHLTNAVILFFLFKKFMRESIAVCLAILFVIHPMNAESVDYMAAGSNILVFLFGVIAISRVKKPIYAGFFLLLALLTNEAGLSWVLIALTYLWLYKKWTIPHLSALLVLPLGVYGFLHLFISKASFHTFSYVPIARLSLEGRLLTLPKVLAYYLTTAFYPAYLSIAQHWTVTAVTFQGFVLPILIDLVAIAAGTLGGVYLFRRHQKLFRPYVFFVLWFIFGIAPYLQIVPLDMTVADRWFYLPLAGLLGMIGILVQTIKFSQTKKVIGLILFCMIVIALSGRTVVRNANWHDGITLFSHDVHSNPDSFDLHAKLAGELLIAKRYDEAMAHAQTAVTLQPDDVSSLGTLALLKLHAQQPEQAIIYFKKLLDRDPTNYPGLTNLIYAYLLVKNLESAKKYTLTALEHYPNDESLMMFLQMSQTGLPNDPQR